MIHRRFGGVRGEFTEKCLLTREDAGYHTKHSSEAGGTLRMARSSHTLDRVEVMFDGDRMVADAGLILPATLAQKLGVEALADELVSVGHRPGRKLLTVVHALLAGGDCIDDTDVLRSGAPPARSLVMR